MVIMILCGRWQQRILIVYDCTDTYVMTAIIIPEEAGEVIFLGSQDNVDPDYLPRNTQ